jgi:hypothetical protein
MHLRQTSADAKATSPAVDTATAAATAAAATATKLEQKDRHLEEDLDYQVKMMITQHQTKSFRLIHFGLRARLSAPESQVKTGVDARLKNAYRKSFENLREDPDYYTTSNTAPTTTSTTSTKPFSLRAVASRPRSQVTTTCRC